MTKAMLFLKVFYIAERQTFVERRPVIYELSTQTEREKQKSNIFFKVKIVRTIYYIFSYYIFGWDRRTENVITENVIHSTKLV